MSNNQRGFSAIEGIFILIIISIIGFTGWRIWQNSQKASHTNPNPSSSIQDSSAQLQTQPNSKNSLTIKEWGVKLPVASSEASRFTYTLSEKYEADGQNAILIDNKMLEIEKNWYESKYGLGTLGRPCAAREILTRNTDGLLEDDATGTRIKPPDGIRGVYTKKLGKYYYRVAPGQGCGYIDETFNKQIDDIYKTGFSAFKWDLSGLEVAP